MNRSWIPALGERDTPFYFYDLEVLENTLTALQGASEKHRIHVHYAVKANPNPTILKHIQAHGFGADCVSGGEVKAAIQAGFPADQVVFAGVGKSDREINFGLDRDIFCFNVESVQELEVIDQLAGAQGTKARVALRINPDVNANTHRYITTGLEENKFGINPWELPEVTDRLQALEHVELVGLHVHIGSQITDLEPFRNLCNRINEIHGWFFERKMPLQHLNLGGGLGINYDTADQPVPDFEGWLGLFRQFLDVHPRQQLHVEPGRAVVGHCGSLVSRVLYVKESGRTRFAILDAGMTELIRPALYQAHHPIQNLTQQGRNPDRAAWERYDVVGPICESSDTFGKAVSLPRTSRGDLIAIRSAGAYGEAMVSNYNLRERPGVVFSSEL